VLFVVVYRSPALNTDIALVPLVVEPQITLVAEVELPQRTLKPCVALLPQITEEPHTKDWP